MTQDILTTEAERRFVTVRIECEVTDADALYEAASRRAHAEKLDEAIDGLRDEDGIDAGACLRMLLDPGYVPDAGFEILESSSEEQ